MKIQENIQELEQKLAAFSSTETESIARIDVLLELAWVIQALKP